MEKSSLALWNRPVFTLYIKKSFFFGRAKKSLNFDAFLCHFFILQSSFFLVSDSIESSNCCTVLEIKAKCEFFQTLYTYSMYLQNLIHILIPFYSKKYFFLSWTSKTKFTYQCDVWNGNWARLSQRISCCPPLFFVFWDNC